jgi:hypothetical protein
MQFSPSEIILSLFSARSTDLSVSEIKNALDLASPFWTQLEAITASVAAQQGIFKKPLFLFAVSAVLSLCISRFGMLVCCSHISKNIQVISLASEVLVSTGLVPHKH